MNYRGFTASPQVGTRKSRRSGLNGDIYEGFDEMTNPQDGGVFSGMLAGTINSDLGADVTIRDFTMSGVQLSPLKPDGYTGDAEGHGHAARPIHCDRGCRPFANKPATERSVTFSATVHHWTSLCRIDSMGALGGCGTEER